MGDNSLEASRHFVMDYDCNNLDEKIFNCYKDSCHLYGDKNITQTASNVSVRNGSVNTISMNSGAAAEQIRARIIAALIPLDIQPDALQTVLRAINELNLE